MSDANDWMDEMRKSHEYVADNAKLDFAVAIERQLQHQHVARKELASRIDASPAYITKVLRGDGNLTIESMAKISHALDCKLSIHITRSSSQVRWYEVHQGTQKAADPQIEVARIWARHAA